MNNSPFKFLDSYTKEDKDLFFGRDSEIEKLYSLVFESKTLLVYGVSGTGKSSLIHCGLANKFNEADWLPINIRRGSDMLESFWNALEKTALTPLKKPEKLTAGKFKKAIQSIYLDHFKPVFFIYDQFEELFVFGSEEEQKEFLAIIKSITESDLQTRFVFVIREEYLAWFTEFESEIPTILDNRLRIEKMTRENARQAIEGPSQLVNIEVEEDFSQTLLQKLSPNQNQVELTYLQVYLDKLYRMAQKDVGEEGQLQFTKKLIDQSGNISDLLGSFLEEQIAQLEDPNAGLKVLKAFVSTKGTKRQINIQEAQNYIKTLGADLPQEQISQLITQFVNLRILRDKDEADRFELRHDALAAKIFEKITLAEKELLEIRQFIEHAYDNYQKREILLSQEDLDYVQPFLNKLFLEKKHKTFLEESKKELLKAKKRRQLIIASLAITLFLIMAGFSWWAISERKKAEQKEVEFKAMYFNSVADDLKEKEPEQALRLFQYAYELNKDKKIYQGLLDVYYNSLLCENYIQDKYVESIVYSNELNLFAFLVQNNLKIYDNNKLIKAISETSDIKFFDFDPVKNELWTIQNDTPSYFIRKYKLDDDQYEDIKIKDEFFIEVLDKFNYANSNIKLSAQGKYFVFFNTESIAPGFVSLKYYTYDIQNEIVNDAYSIIGNLKNVKEQNNDNIVVGYSEKTILSSYSNKLYLDEDDFVSYDRIYFVDQLGRFFLAKKGDNISLFDFNGDDLGFSFLLEKNDRIEHISLDKKFLIIKRSDELGNYFLIMDFWGRQLGKIKNEEISDPRKVFVLGDYVYFHSTSDQILRYEISHLDSFIYEATSFFIDEYSKQIVLTNNKETSIIDSSNHITKYPFSLTDNVFFGDIYLLYSSLSNTVISVGEKYLIQLDIVKGDTSQIQYSHPKPTSINDVYFNNHSGQLFISSFVNTDSLKCSYIDCWDSNMNLSFSLKRNEYILRFIDKTNISNTCILNTSDSILELSHQGEIMSSINKPYLLKNQEARVSYLSRNDSSKEIFAEFYYFLYERNFYQQKDLNGYVVYAPNMMKIGLFNNEFEMMKFTQVPNVLGEYVKGKAGNIENSSKQFFFGQRKSFLIDTLGFIHNSYKSLNNSINNNSYRKREFLLGRNAYYLQNNKLYRKKLKRDYSKLSISKYIDKISINNQLYYKTSTIDDILKSRDTNDLIEAIDYCLFLYKTNSDENPQINIDNILKLLELSKSKLPSSSYYEIFEFLSDEEDILVEIKRSIGDLTSLPSSAKDKISGAATNAAYQNLLYSNFEVALELSEYARKANPRDNILYTNLALSYLLTDNWLQAKEIYETYQDSSYNNGTRTCKQGFLEDLDEMEKLGITHPDFQKVKELLGVTEETKANEQ